MSEEYNENNREEKKIYMNVEPQNIKTEEGDAFGGSKREPYYNETVKCNKRKQNNTGFKKFIAGCLIISLVGGGSIGAGFSLTQNFMDMIKGKRTSVTAQVEPQEAVIADETVGKSSVSMTSGNTAVDIIKRVTPSVVNIVTTVKGNAQYFNGFSVPYEGAGAGSGIIFYEDETMVAIATNDHVVEGASTIGITIDDDTELIPAKIVGTDSTADLAVIAVTKADLTKAGISNVTIAKFGNSDKLEVGETVIAIGNAMGEGKSATSGMVSALGKKIEVDGKELDVIQTDAAINQGNSGGALVDLNGDVVGINTAKAFKTSVEGMGYAIPSNVIIPIINKLLKEGTAPKPYLGIVGVDVTDELAQLYGLPVGILVKETVQGGSALKGGVQAGDIITDFAGNKIMSMESLVSILAKREVGETVPIRVIRDGTTPVELKVTIQDANADNE